MQTIRIFAVFLVGGLIACSRSPLASDVRTTPAGPRLDAGETGGVPVCEIPLHTHTLGASIDPGDNTVPGPIISLGQSTGAFQCPTE